MSYKNCRNCANRKGFTFAYGTCMLSGYYLQVERKFPTACGRQFQNWQPRPTIFMRIKEAFTGAKS